MPGPTFYDTCGCGQPKQRRSATCKRCCNDARKPATPGTPDSFEVTGNSAELTKTTTEKVRTLADMIRVCDIDTSVWEVERYLVNKWEVGAAPRTIGCSKHWVRASNKVLVTPLYQVKVWLKRRVALIDARGEIEALKADAKRELPVKARVVRSSILGDNLLEVSIPDLHVGKLAWAEETGQGHYDRKIALKLFEEALDVLIRRTSGFSIAKVLFIVGNDIFHSDNPEGTTTSGTQLDTDGRFHKTFRSVRLMVTRAIDRLRLLAPVHVLMMPGNHDRLSVWHLGDSIECLYDGVEDVTIDNAPKQRKYYQHGDVMLMFAHGDLGKVKDYPLLMAAEQPAMWGATKFREAHIGHRHEKKIDEQHGIRVRTLSALCAPDAWHAENGFVGNLRAAEAFVWSPSEGEVGSATFTVREAA